MLASAGCTQSLGILNKPQPRGGLGYITELTEAVLPLCQRISGLVVPDAEEDGRSFADKSIVFFEAEPIVWLP